MSGSGFELEDPASLNYAATGVDPMLESLQAW
jgi:hypothetical protein